MNYSKENRKEILKKYKIITSIDRVKLTYQLPSKNSILNENFKYMDRVRKGKVTEIGLYAVYISLIDQDVIYKFVRAFIKILLNNINKKKSKSL